ncbi:MAG: hypothetical protein SGI96_21320 [Bacteroidota bacterium]|nr:hypothetical protein [Bacteroidota bacterium]
MKTPNNIESTMNEFLKKVSLKKVIQEENASSGKIYYTLFYTDSSEGDCEVRVVRAIGAKAIAKSINESIKNADLFEVTQTSQNSGHTVLTALFIKKKRSKKDELEN